MNTRVLLSVYAVLIGIGGLAWLLVPAPLLGLYGVTSPDAAAILLARLIGGTGLGLGAMAWLGRNAVASPAGEAMLVGITVASVLGTGVCLLGALSPALNAYVWVPTGVYAVFTLLFGMAAQANREAGGRLRS